MLNLETLPTKDANERYAEMQIRLQTASLIATLMQGGIVTTLEAAAKAGDSMAAMYADGAYTAMQDMKALYDRAVNTNDDLMETYMKSLEEGLTK